MLEIRGLTAGHGRRTVLRDLTFDVGPGEVLAVLGANGVGKSTLLRTLAGLLPELAGDVLLDGESLTGTPTHARVRRGLVLVPDGQQSFPAMSVEENLIVGLSLHKDAHRQSRLDGAYDLFPRLAERRTQAAGTLSGGERQMLAIARAMLADPKVLMLDEPSHGLAPIVVEQIAESIRQVAQTTPTLLVEQNLSIPQHCATRVLVVEDGVITASGDPETLLNSDRVVAAYLGM